MITFINYINASWEQVREICIIAVAEDAFDALVAASDLKPGRRNTRPPETLDIDRDRVMDVVLSLKYGSVGNNLLAAICRVAVRIESLGFVERRDSLFCGGDAITWQIVHYVYKEFKRGRVEPIVPFLRVSRRTDTQSCSDPSQGRHFLNSQLSISASKAVLVYGEAHTDERNRKEQSILCVYFACESLDAPNRENLAAVIKETFENRDVYHTTRDNGRYNLKPTKYWGVPWNLARTYGVHFRPDGLGFPDWLHSLNASLPTRQGSPRDRFRSVRFIPSREYSPWFDHRCADDGDYLEQRIKFMRKLVASEYQFWRKFAQKCLIFDAVPTVLGF